MDKAPDAFRTISEVADDLDIPQHVLRFWETRFSQIKPMKRSGGRRYYRPDDVDLLRGIRRLLYGEGYTIRGVQRILKENGIKAVQGLDESDATSGFSPVRAAASGAAPSGSAPAPRPVVKPPVVEDEPEEDLEDEDEDVEDEEAVEGDESEDEESEDDDGETDDTDDEEADAEDAEEAAPLAASRPPEPRPAPPIQPPVRTEPIMSRANPVPPPRINPAPPPRAEPPARSLDRERLEAVLEELLAARRAIDEAMKD